MTIVVFGILRVNSNACLSGTIESHLHDKISIDLT